MIYKPLSFIGDLNILKNPLPAIIKKTAKDDSVNSNKKFKFNWDLFIQQLLDSAIVGGIAFFIEFASNNWTITSISAMKSIGAFGLAFLIKLKTYRKISDE